MVVVYGTPKEKVDCPTCRLRAVPNKAITEPQSNTQVIVWNGRIKKGEAS